MKNNFLKLILLLLLLPVFCLVIFIFVPSQYENSFLGELKYKVSRLETLDGPRIIFIGGSSVPFSLNSALIQKSFPDYNIVDFGMYADLGTVAMLDLAQNDIHENDIIIISPEQNAQTLSCYFSGEDYLEACDGAPALITHLSFDRYEKLIAAFPVFSYNKLKLYLSSGKNYEGIYQKASFNEYGDIDAVGREFNVMSAGYNPNDLILFKEDIISSDFIEELNSFATFASNQGASVYYHFPPMNEMAIDVDFNTDIDDYYNYLSSVLNFPIIGNPHNSVLNEGWFYDTNFHLNESGAILYTKLMIDDLKILFNDTSVTNIQIPSMPETEMAYNYEETSDSIYFTYELTSNGYIITGLTKDGLSRKTLSISGLYQGTKVTGALKEAFTNNLSLEEITIPPCIGTLYDGMFNGCSNLSKIILTGTSPSMYSVGDELLQNCNAKIYVPENSLNQYKRDYSWNVYSKFLYSE